MWSSMAIGYLLPEQGELVLHGVVGDVPLVGQLFDFLVGHTNLEG